jgi:hypothetical protein
MVCATTLTVTTTSTATTTNTSLNTTSSNTTTDTFVATVTVTTATNAIDTAAATTNSSAAQFQLLPVLSSFPSCSTPVKVSAIFQALVSNFLGITVFPQGFNPLSMVPF